MSSPNILFILTDQQRWDCVGVNGNDLIRTPSLDALARDGINFSHSFVNAMACVPSRACIMSGQHVSAHGVRVTGAGGENDQWLRPEVPTLPGTFSANGYHSVGVGKMHFSPWYTPGGFDRRVIVESKYNVLKPDEYQVVLRELGLADKTIGHHTDGFGAAYKSIATTELPAQYHIDNYVGRRGVETLKEVADQDKPFFLAVSFCGPHDPFDPPPPYDTMYRHEDMPLGQWREGELDCLSSEVSQSVRDMGMEHLDLTAVPEAKKREITAHYYGNVSLIDHWVGQLVDELKARGLYEDTIILFTSDHGEYLGDHNIYFKGYFPCDSDTRVPLILKVPGGAPGTTCEGLTGNVNLMPTLLDLAGLSVPGSVQGRSLLPMLRGEGAGDDAVVTFSERGPAWRLRTRDWAYVFRGDTGHDQLYHMPDDPHELDNLAGRPAAREICEQLLRQLVRRLDNPAGMM